MLLPILALGLGVLRHALDQLLRHDALVLPSSSAGLQVAEALLHRVHEEISQLPVAQVLGQ